MIKSSFKNIGRHKVPCTNEIKSISQYSQNTTPGNALTQRWTEFLGYAVPYLTRVITLVVSGGASELKKNGGSLARDARIIFEKLGSYCLVH